MVRRFHGIDRHKWSATISILDRTGTEIKFIQSCSNLNGYIDALGPDDGVYLRLGSGAFIGLIRSERWELPVIS